MTPEDWLSEQFDRCWPMLERAVKKMRQGYGRDVVWQQLSSGNAQLFPGINAAVVTQLITDPNGNPALSIWLASGPRKEVMRLAENAEQWAKKRGCKRVCFTTRIGAIRRPFEGYKTTAILMEKDL